MPVDWNEITKELRPIKDYDDLCRRWREAFVREKYNFSMPKLAEHTRQLLGGDTRGRYSEYCAHLVRTFDQLHQAGVHDLRDLTQRVDSPQLFEAFTGQSGVQPGDTAAALKYLVYWFIPMKKPLNSLVDADSPLFEAFKALRGLMIRSNLDLLERGATPEMRVVLRSASGLQQVDIVELVNRADLTRLPWASKATISNIIGAGYGSLTKLANADPEQLMADFLRYGESIGKNLKLGNEIENSYRIARLMPILVEE